LVSGGKNTKAIRLVKIFAQLHISPFDFEAFSNKLKHERFIVKGKDGLI
jgi:hypothetical protein